MANVSWSNPGTSGDWSSTTDWAGLTGGESFPGSSLGDSVTIGGSNSTYVVIFDVSTATISSLDIEGGNGSNHFTTLRMTAGATLNILGGVTLLKKDTPAAIDGAGRIAVAGAVTALGAGSVGLITAGTATSGGVLDLTGTGFITSPFVFAIGTAGPTTLEFDLSGGVVTSTAITINNINQTLEIGPSGSLTIQADQNVTLGQIKLDGGSLIDLGVGGISFGNGGNSGSLSGFGLVAVDALTRSGSGTADTITATGGKLTLITTIGANSGLVFDIDNSPVSSLQLDITPGTGNTFTFLGPNGNLALIGFETFNDTVAGLNVGLTTTPTNFIDILGTKVTVTSQTDAGTSGSFTLSNGDTFNLTGITNASAPWHVLTKSDGGGGTDVFLSTVCYVRGTMIRTPAGEQPIETLRSGMQVITLVDGEEIPQTVTWLGHRRISLAGHPQPETVAPIRIERDAFADGMPRRDLMVSPDHAIFVDGMLICAKQLVNGTTIRQERDGRAVHYYHVELDQHAILLAEGLPAESYIDTGNKGFFANSGSPLVLHPDLTDEIDYPTREAGSCAPFVTDEANVQPVWQRLADRAAAIGRTVSQRVTTTDASLRLVADGRTVKPVFSDSQRVIFALRGGASEVRLVSSAQSPTEARPWLEDRRRLGVRVKRIALRGGGEIREVPVDHPELTRGWWAVERDGQMISRWTDGEAVLPLPAMRGHVMLEIHLAGAMTFVEDAVPGGGTERRAAA
jgi:hypothetical protein